MFLTEEGKLWVEIGPLEGVRTYDVYERTGAYVGAAQTTLGVLPWLRPIVRGEQFWAVVKDDLDVQYVVRARIISNDP